MDDVLRVAAEIARLLERSGISVRGAMHALARAADEGEGSAVTAVLVRDGNSFAFSTAMAGAKASWPSRRRELHSRQPRPCFTDTPTTGGRKDERDHQVHLGVCPPEAARQKRDLRRRPAPKTRRRLGIGCSVPCHGEEHCHSSSNRRPQLPPLAPTVRPAGVTAKDLLVGNVPESAAVERVWSRPDLRRQKIDCFSVYRHKQSATAHFDHDSDAMALGPDLLHVYDLVAVFKVSWRPHEDVYRRQAVVEVGDCAWTAQQLLDGEAEDSESVKVVWRRPETE